MSSSRAIMIEAYRDRIISHLREAGEKVEEADSFVATRLGEGLGYTSMLWSVQVGGGRYAAKITGLKSRFEEATTIEAQAKIDSLTTLFAQQHNRELQAYRYFESIRPTSKSNLDRVPRFYGGVECTNEKGFIIMADLSEHAVACELSQPGWPLNTVLSTISGIVGYQCAYLSSDVEVDFLAKDLIFEMISASVTARIESVDKQGYLSEQWKSALLSWSTPEALRKMQYEREPGDPPLVLCHTDIWANNLLFKRGEETSDHLELLAIVDWQCATVGLALLDIASVVGMNMSPEERRKNGNSILRHYLDTMEERKKDFVKEFNAEFDNAHRLYRRCLRFPALLLCLHVGAHVGLFEAAADETEKEREKRVNDADQHKFSVERLKGILEDIVDP